MTNKKNGIRFVMSISLVLFVLVAISDCSHLGRKYTAFKVTSVPSGASVDSLIDNKISGGTFVNASHGTTPTGVKVVYYAFGAPGVGDTKIGVRISMPGYETKDVFFEPDDWHETAEEAKKHIKEI